MAKISKEKLTEIVNAAPVLRSKSEKYSKNTSRKKGKLQIELPQNLTSC